MKESKNKPWNIQVACTIILKFVEKFTLSKRRDVVTESIKDSVKDTYEKILKRWNGYSHIDRFPDEIYPDGGNCEIMKRIQVKNKI